MALEGLRPTIPPGISPHICKMMRLCMNEDPAKRPKFDMIVPILEKMQDKWLQLSVHLRYSILWKCLNHSLWPLPPHICYRTVNNIKDNVYIRIIQKYYVAFSHSSARRCCSLIIMEIYEYVGKHIEANAVTSLARSNKYEKVPFLHMNWWHMQINV